MKNLVMYICLLCAMPVVQASEAMQLLNQMSVAVHKLDYEGDLVYSQGNGFSLFRIQHSIDENGVERERISSLDGDGYLQTGEDGRFSVARFPKIDPAMQDVYSFDIGGIAQVAGRACKEVVARPKDRMRYLHRYCIDSETNMLLNYSLIDTNHKAVERMMFTHISYSKPNFKDYIKNKVSKLKDKFKPFDLIKKKKNKTHWRFSELPKGFYVDSILTKDESNSPFPLEQIIITDNVTSISLFIEPESESGVNESHINYRGAVNSLTIEKEEHNITAIGEVPRETLFKVVDSLRYEP